MLPVVVVASGVVAAVLLIVTRDPLTLQQIEPRRLPVEAIEAHPETRRVLLRSQGTVAPAARIALAAEIDGRITRIGDKFEAGVLVEAGETLLVIDPRDYEIALQRAASNVAEARNLLAIEKGLAEAALRDWQHLQGDARSAEATDLALRKPQLASAQAQLKAAEADHQQARLNLERTLIRAPYQALVSRRDVDVGRYLSRGDDIGSLLALERAEVRLPVPENQIDYLDSDDVELKVTLKAEIGDGTQSWRGRVARTEEVLDERSRTLFVIAEVADPYRLRRGASGPRLRFGSFVVAEIQGREFSGLTALPRHLLRAGDHLWVIDGENRLRNRAVKILNTDGEIMLVRSGLAAGDLTCLSPVGNVLAGTAVHVTAVQRSDRLGRDGGATNALQAPRATR